LGDILKKLRGGPKFGLFFVFCAAVFSSTAAPKNNPIGLK
jgi:hypothetical protein